MNKFMIIYLYFIACVWRMGSGAKFLSSIDWKNWMHLEFQDIKLLAVDNFIDDFNECPDLCIPINKLENTTASVVPAANIAEHPLNKFIGIEELDATLHQTLTSICTNELVGSDSRNVLTLLKEILQAVKPQLQEAIQKRLDVLVDLKKERVEKAFGQSLRVINEILSTAVENGNDIENTWQTFVQEVQSANLPNEAIKILSYPVVKQQIVIAENKYQKSDKKKLDYYLETIIPFLKEGLIKEDERIVNGLPHKIAKEELERKLVLKYTLLIEEAISDAKLVDNFLQKAYNDDDLDRMSSNLVAQIIDEEYMHGIRKAISIYLYFANRIFAKIPDFPIEHYTTCTEISQENVHYLVKLIGTPAHWRHAMKKFKNPLCEAVGEKFRRRDIRHIPQIERLFNLMKVEYEEAVRTACKVYKKENQSFTKESASKMGEILNRLLEKQYNDIHESDIDILKTQLSRYKTYLEFPEDVLHVAKNLQNFQEEMNTLAETSFNFTSGAFLFSESYFDVLEKLIPIKRNAIDNDIPVKTEL